MDRTIRHQLLSAEENFLSSIADGPDAVRIFDRQWQKLLQDWEEHGESLEVETIELAQATAARISILSQCFIDLDAKTASLTDSICSACDESLLHIHPQTIPLPLPHEDSEYFQTYSVPCIWLLHNLHNPYPPPALKISMDRIPTSATKPIGDWFTKARQRIGWTRIMRDRFGGSRSAMVDAAFRAYIRDDPTNPLDPELLSEFLDMKVNAEHIILEMTGEGCNTKGFRSHQNSRSVSPVPSLTYSSTTDDSDDDVFSLIVPPKGLKRSMSQCFEESEHPSTGLEDEKSFKRRRSDFPKSLANSLATTPAQGNNTVTVVQAAPCSRKRRLSDSDSDQHLLKRPRGLQGLRLHAVSNPFPISVAQSGLEDWFDHTFELPSPATMNTPGISSLNYDLFNPTSLEPMQNCALVAGTPSLTKSLSISSSSLPMANESELSSFLFSSTEPQTSVTECSWNDFIGLDLDSDVSSSVLSGALSVSPHVDLPTLSPEFNFDIHTVPTLPSTMETTASSSKSLFDLSPMLQAFSDFFSPNHDKPIDALSPFQGVSDVSLDWLAM